MDLSRPEYQVSIDRNLDEGGDMLQPMAIGAIGGLLLEMHIALLLMPYTLTARHRESKMKKPKKLLNIALALVYERMLILFP